MNDLNEVSLDRGWRWLQSLELQDARLRLLDSVLRHLKGRALEGQVQFGSGEVVFGIAQELERREEQVVGGVVVGDLGSGQDGTRNSEKSNFSVYFCINDWISNFSILNK